MAALKGPGAQGVGSLMSKIKEKSASVVQNVAKASAGGGLDMHLVSERLAAMSFPADGLEAATAFKHHIDDVAAVLESRHPGESQCFFLNWLILCHMAAILSR